MFAVDCSEGRSSMGSAESRSSLTLYLFSVHNGERSSRFSSGHLFSQTFLYSFPPRSSYAQYSSLNIDTFYRFLFRSCAQSIFQNLSRLSAIVYASLFFSFSLSICFSISIEISPFAFS